MNDFKWWMLACIVSSFLLVIMVHINSNLKDISKKLDGAYVQLNECQMSNNKMQ